MSTAATTAAILGLDKALNLHLRQGPKRTAKLNLAAEDLDLGTSVFLAA